MFPENVIPGTSRVSTSDEQIRESNHSVSAFGSSTGTFNGISMSILASCSWCCDVDDSLWFMFWRGRFGLGQNLVGLAAESRANVCSSSLA